MVYLLVVMILTIGISFAVAKYVPDIQTKLQDHQQRVSCGHEKSIRMDGDQLPVICI